MANSGSCAGSPAYPFNHKGMYVFLHEHIVAFVRSSSFLLISHFLNGNFAEN
jgi:hypothetical protein